jgi:hypothetical protein
MIDHKARSVPRSTSSPRNRSGSTAWRRALGVRTRAARFNWPNDGSNRTASNISQREKTVSAMASRQEDWWKDANHREAREAARLMLGRLCRNMRHLTDTDRREIVARELDAVAAWLRAPRGERQKANRRPSLKQLKTAMANAHPDHGGNDEAFRVAHAAYQARQLEKNHKKDLKHARLRMMEDELRQAGWWPDGSQKQ